MITLKVLTLTALLALPSPATKPIEQAFLQNSPEALAGLFPAGGAVLLSLPEPISFADQISSEQAYFLFERLFSIYKTTEFIIDPETSSLPGKPGRILKARRWSFQNTRTGLQYPFRIFFYLGPDPRGPGRDGLAGIWKILEIRAEKI